jgi:uncharacterized protein DUF3634
VTGFFLFGALALALVPLVIGILRSTELCVLRVRDGEVRLSRGRIPQGLLDDIGDVVRSPPLREARLRVVRRSGKPELMTRGHVPPDQMQRLRNVIGQYSVQRIAAGGRRRS